MKLDDQQTRSVLQQVLDSTASLRLEEKDLQDAASILSEDPSVNLDVDAILLSTPLYQKVYTKRHTTYSSNLPVIGRRISRKEVGHIRGSSTGSSGRSSKERPLDPYYAENLGLPFLGIPFHGEAPMPSLEEDLETEELDDDTDTKERKVHEKSLPKAHLNHLSTFTIAPNENMHIVEGSAISFSDHVEVSRSSEVFRAVDEDAAIATIDPDHSTINKRAVQKSDRLLSQESDILSRNVAERLPVIHLRSGSSSGFQLESQEAAVKDELPLQRQNIEPKEILIHKNRAEVFVPASHVVKDLPIIPSVATYGPDNVAQEGYCEGASSVGNKDTDGVQSSAEQCMGVEAFDINFGPGPSLDIPDLQSVVKYNEGVLNNKSPKIGNHNVIAEKADGNPTLSIASRASISESLDVHKTAPPTHRPSPAPSTSPSEVPHSGETMPGLVESNNSDNAEVTSKEVGGTTRRKEVGTSSTRADPSFPLRSQTLDTIASTADLTAATGTFSSENLPGASLQHDQRIGTQQNQVNEQNVKIKGNIQSARDVVGRSFALMQRRNRPDITGHIPSTRRLPKLSSMSILSVSSMFKQGEKISAICAAASIGNSQQLIELLEENAKLANTNTVQLSSDGISGQRTPFMCAAIDGHVYCMEVLRKYGADLMTTDKKGKTALHLAVEAEQVESVKSLVKLAADAGTNGQSAYLTKLLEAADTDGSKPLHIATTKGAFDIFKTLVDAGADVNARNNLVRTPLHCAVTERQDDIATNLVSRGAAVDALDSSRETPLMLAVKYNVPAISYLLQGGADKSVIDTNGDTVLHHAARLGQLKAVELLYTRMEDLQERNRRGERPLHLAASHNNKDVVVDLLKRGVDANPWSAPPRSKSGLMSFVPMTSREAIKCSYLTLPGTPLHYACYAGCYDSTEALLKHGAWINAALQDAQTPLMLAVQAQNLRLISLLLTKGAKVNAATSKDCLTALHYACATGDFEITKLLVSYGANTRALSTSSIQENPAAYGARIQRKNMSTARLEAAQYVAELNIIHSQRPQGLPLEILSPAIDDVS